MTKIIPKSFSKMLSTRTAITSFTLACLFIVGAVQTIAAQTAEKEVSAEAVALTRCHEEEFGLSFLCSPDWRAISEDGMLIIVISQKPRVTLTLIRSEENIYFLDKLTTPILKAIGPYSDDFQVQETTLAGRAALTVVGVSPEDSQIGLLDSYVVKDGRLYSFLFAFSPRTVWPAYQELVLEVRNSFEFEEKESGR